MTTDAQATLPAEALGAHASAVHLGGWEHLKDQRAFIPALNQAVRGKAFLLEALGLTGMELSFSSIPAGRGTPFYHRHEKNEELYVVVSGRGQMQVDGHVTDIGPGSAVRVAPEGSRALRCLGDEPMVYLVIQAEAGSYTTPGGVTDGRPVPGEVTWPDQAVSPGP